MEIEFTMDAPVDAAASSTAANVASTAAVASSIAPAAPAAPAVAAAPAARLEAHLTTALQALYKSALIVEQGVAQPAPSTALDPQLERLMGIAQPAMKHADMTNQNLQRQLSVEQQQRQSLQSIDHVGRELQFSVPKSVIDCVEHGENPSALTGRFLDETRYANESVRAQIFATKMLHDQLALRMELWDQVLEKEALAGNEGAKNLLRDSATPKDVKQEATL